MKKIIRLTESDLTRIVRRVIKEQQSATSRQYLMEEEPKWVSLTPQKLNFKSWDITMRVSYLPVKDPQNSFYKASSFSVSLNLSETQTQNLRSQGSNTSFLLMNTTDPDLLTAIRNIVPRYVNKNQHALSGIASNDVELEIKRLHDLFKGEYTTKISSAQKTATAVKPATPTKPQ
jgi:hypothetical protein